MHCHEATRTLSAAQERKLALGERVSLQLHLAICSKCRNFEDQVVFLRNSMRAYARRPGDPAGDRENNDASSE